MKPTYQFIKDISQALGRTDRYMKASDLAKLLNMAGFHTSYNTPYVEEPNRGIHRVLSEAYRAIAHESSHQESAEVAGRFTDENGNTPWW